MPKITTDEQLIDMNKVNTAILEAEKDNDELIDAKEALSTLRRKHFK